MTLNEIKHIKDQYVIECLKNQIPIATIQILYKVKFGEGIGTNRIMRLKHLDPNDHKILELEQLIDDFKKSIENKIENESYSHNYSQFKEAFFELYHFFEAIRGILIERKKISIKGFNSELQKLNLEAIDKCLN